MMRRRAFITLLGGAAAWPLAAPAQQPERIRRIGLLMPLAAEHCELVEIAEDHLFAAVKLGKQWAIERVLRTVGKDLGYGDSVEVSGPGAAVSVRTVIEFEFVEPTPRDDDGKTIDGKLA